MPIHIQDLATAGALVLCALLASPAYGQDGAANDPQLAALAGKLRAGDKVAITDPSGRVVRGRLQTLSPDALTVLVDGGEPRTLTAAGIARVQRTRTGVLLGSIIGGGAGIAAGAALASLVENEGGNAVGAFLFPVAVGLGAGIGIDALVNLPRTVYRHAPATRLTAVPIVGAGRRGAAVSVTF